MKTIILTVNSSPRNPDGVRNAHQVFEVEGSLLEEFNYHHYEVIHTEDYTMLVALVDSKEQYDALQAAAKKYWEAF
jgi:hypothetical protein